MCVTPMLHPENLVVQRIKIPGTRIKTKDIIEVLESGASLRTRAPTKKNGIVPYAQLIVPLGRGCCLLPLIGKGLHLADKPGNGLSLFLAKVFQITDDFLIPFFILLMPRQERKPFAVISRSPSSK